jgi:hypothetical protein
MDASWVFVTISKIWFTTVMNPRILKTTQLAGVHFVYQSITEALDNSVESDLFEMLPNGKKVFYVIKLYKGMSLKHFLFNSTYIVLENWKDAEEGDWCKLDDGGIVLCLRRFVIPNKKYPKHNQPIVRFINGSFNANNRYDYKSTSLFKDRADLFSASTKGNFTWKSKHSNFVTHFIILLMIGSQIDEAKIDAWKTFNDFEEEQWEKNLNYRYKLDAFINIVLRSEEAMGIIQKMTAKDQTLKDLLTKNNLTRKDMVEKVAKELSQVTPSSKNYVGILNLVESWNDKADLEEKLSEKDKEPELPKLPADAESASYTDVTDVKEEMLLPAKQDGVSVVVHPKLSFKDL